MSDEKKENGAIKSTIAKIKKIKHIEIIVAIIAVLIMLAIYFGGLGSGTGKGSKGTLENGKINYCQYLQDQLEELVSGLSGAGKAKVLISWESSIELILAETTNNNGGSSSSSPVIVQNSGSSSPVVLKEIYPKAVGVLIICQGGNDPKIKINLIMAVSALLDISPDKVIVYAMTK